MGRQMWTLNNNQTLLLSVFVLINVSTFSTCFPQHKVTVVAPPDSMAQSTHIRNLSDMDEDLVTDSDAAFESRRIETTASDSPEPAADGQHFFPSFASLFSNHPLGHSRPPIYDDPPINHRPRHIPYALQQANSFTGNSDYFGNSNTNTNINNNNNNNNNQQSTQSKGVTSAVDQNVLGSGNFGVIKGGTYYEDDYDNDDFFSYNNGHGRPSNNFNSYYNNHQPSSASNHQSGSDDFFSNFRDFADITAPKSAYSEFHVIYVNKNGTEINTDKNSKPRNIFEQLTRLDESESKSLLSKKKVNGKKKLEAHKAKESEKFYKKKQALASPKEFYHEPLLALS